MATHTYTHTYVHPVDPSVCQIDWMLSKSQIYKTYIMCKTYAVMTIKIQ